MMSNVLMAAQVTNPPDPHDKLAPILDLILEPLTLTILSLGLLMILFALGLLLHERTHR
jgi:hypothetical protein